MMGLVVTGLGMVMDGCCVSTCGWERGVRPANWHAIIERVNMIIAGKIRFIHHAPKILFLKLPLEVHVVWVTNIWGLEL